MENKKIFLSDLGKVWGISKKQEKKKELKPRKCFRCGGEMVYIEGTNVYACTGSKKDKQGVERPCMNRILLGTRKDGK